MPEQAIWFRWHLTGQMEIDLGGLKVVLDRVAHSHSKGSVFVYIPGRKVLFAGDILFTEYYANMGSSNIAGWAKTIDHLMGLDINHIIPGHGPLSEKKQLADMRDYLFIFDEKAKELSTSNSDIKLEKHSIH
jgi:glyoxylase-like metal-dependent hydrolase (beta-lactamase superfamily II)